jgi:hypothetical protein
VAAAVSCAATGCGGGDDYANKPRPATPVNVTAAITGNRISISPKTFGAGPIVMIVSNQSDKPQTVTIETEELGGNQAGLKEKTGPIGPDGTGTLKVDVRKGSYAVSVPGGGIEPTSLEVGPARQSAQDELLQP